MNTLLTTGQVCDVTLYITSILKLRLVHPLFKEIPLLADRLLLLNVLATDLPLEITVPIIHEDVYWRRCYEKRWPKQLPKNVANEVTFPMCSSNTSSRSETVIDDSHTNHSEDVSPIINNLSCFETKTWKHYYLEMHVKVFLEYLRPEEYEPEKVNDCISYICAIFHKMLGLGKAPGEHMCSLRFSTEHVTVAMLL